VVEIYENNVAELLIPSHRSISRAAKMGQPCNPCIVSDKKILEIKKDK